MKQKTKTGLILSLMMVMCSCSTTPASPKTIKSTKTIKARITYYFPERPFWKKVSDPNTKVAKEGITVAAHPDFKFGTKIFIPALQGKVGNGAFVVQDRGTAVTSKKAANGSGYVFDVFVSNRSKMNQFAKSVGMWADVEIN